MGCKKWGSVGAMGTYCSLLTCLPGMELPFYRVSQNSFQLQSVCGHSLSELGPHHPDPPHADSTKHIKQQYFQSLWESSIASPFPSSNLSLLLCGPLTLVLQSLVLLSLSPGKFL